MRSPKFTMNAFLAVVLIFSAMGFFFTVKMVNLADRFPINDYTMIEGTDYAVHYSSLAPCGIYEGGENTGTLKLEGNFGAEWGAFVSGNDLYINEYAGTDLGLVLCNIVRIDLNTFEKQVVIPNAILRGRCASGEPVCIRGCMLPTNYPETNSLCKLYGMLGGYGSITVEYLDPFTGETVYAVEDNAALKTDFDSRYLNKTLEEVRG